jgi:type II secretory pathway component GspD/PulD (secretin)
LKRQLFLLLCVISVTGAWAQALETIPLRHRTAEELLPQIQPMVEPGGALIGSGDKLFLRASRNNAQQIRQVVGALDRPLRRLMITVRQGGEAEGAETRAGADVRLAPGDSRVRGSVGARSYSSRQDIAQQVQTVEGGRAFINVGRSVFLPFQQAVMTPAGVVVAQSMVQLDIGTGFHAVPRLVGDRVMLDISPRHDTPGPLTGSANVQRISTSVSGRLGEWIALGGSARQDSGTEGGTLRYGTRSAHDDRQVWLKVEELP